MPPNPFFSPRQQCLESSQFISHHLGLSQANYVPACITLLNTEPSGVSAWFLVNEASRALGDPGTPYTLKGLVRASHAQSNGNHTA